MKIADHTMLITGASYGIGAALARVAAREGARVVLLARTQAALEEVAADIRADGGAATVYPVDLTDAGAVERVVRTLLAEVGTPDIVISNAGSGRWLFVEETSADEAVAMMAMPYLAAFYLTRALLPAMLARNAGRLIYTPNGLFSSHRGHRDHREGYVPKPSVHSVNSVAKKSRYQSLGVYVNSPASLVAWPGATGYIAARWALRGFAEALRADLHGTRIRVTTAIPGKVSSSYFANNPGAEQRAPGLARLLPTLTPEQTASLILRGIERDQRQIIIPGGLRMLYRLSAVAPWLVRWLATVTGARRPRA